MAIIAFLILACLHIYLLYYTFMELGILWCAFVIFIPLVGLYVVYSRWRDLKYVFLGEVICWITIAVSASQMD